MPLCVINREENRDVFTFQSGQLCVWEHFSVDTYVDPSPRPSDQSSVNSAVRVVPNDSLRYIVKYSDMPSAYQENKEMQAAYAHHRRTIHEIRSALMNAKDSRERMDHEIQGDEVEDVMIMNEVRTLTRELILRTSYQTVPVMKRTTIHSFILASGISYVLKDVPGAPVFTIYESSEDLVHLDSKISTNCESVPMSISELANREKLISTVVDLEKEPNFIAMYDGLLYVTADCGYLYVVDPEHGGEYTVKKTKLGMNDSTTTQFVGLAATNGLLYLANQCEACVQIYTTSGTFVAEFGNEAGGHAFRKPWGVAISRDRIYILDLVANCVQVRSLDGKFMSVWGSKGNDPGQFDSPRAIATDNMYVYVSDGKNRRVQVFDLDGHYVRSISELQTGYLSYPQGLALSDGLIYVTTDDNIVHVFCTHSGEHIRSFGTSPILDRPWGIAICEKSASAWVCDTRNQRLVRFT